MVNFNDIDSDHGWFYWISKDWQPNHTWWVKLHPKLGESPFSALCAGRFEEVHAVLA